MSEPKPDPSELAKKLKAGKKKIRSDTFLEHVVDSFGGEAALAKKFQEEYDASKLGGIARARLLNAIVQLMERISKRDGPANVETMADEDLDRALEEKIAKFARDKGFKMEGPPNVPPPNPPT